MLPAQQQIHNSPTFSGGREVFSAAFSSWRALPSKPPTRDSAPGPRKPLKSLRKTFVLLSFKCLTCETSIGSFSIDTVSFRIINTANFGRDSPKRLSGEKGFPDGKITKLTLYRELDCAKISGFVANADGKKEKKRTNQGCYKV